MKTSWFKAVEALVVNDRDPAHGLPIRAHWRVKDHASSPLGPKYQKVRIVTVGSLIHAYLSLLGGEGMAQLRFILDWLVLRAIHSSIVTKAQTSV